MVGTSEQMKGEAMGYRQIIFNPLSVFPEDWSCCVTGSDTLSCRHLHQDRGTALWEGLTLNTICLCVWAERRVSAHLWYSEPLAWNGCLHTGPLITGSRAYKLLGAAVHLIEFTNLPRPNPRFYFQPLGSVIS